MLIDRQMQSEIMPELHRWISKLTARTCRVSIRRSLIPMVKETVGIEKELQKMKKVETCSYISH